MTTEADLVNYYDDRPVYWSPLREFAAFERITNAVGQWPAQPILDLGCGDGRLLQHLPKNGLDYTGVDYSATRINLAQQIHPIYANAFVLSGVIDYLETPGRPYESIIAIELLEHLEDPMALIVAARRRLTDTGIIIGTTPINLSDPAHIQVFGSIEDVQARLEPDECEAIPFAGHTHAAMLWHR